MKTQSKVLSVSEGKSLVYLIPGILIIAAAIPFIFFIPIIALILGAFAIILFLTDTGLEIDLAKSRYIRYKRIFGFETGKWQTLSFITEFHISLAVESQTFRAIGYQPNPAWNSSKASSKSITYDLSYVNNAGVKTIIFEFQEYKLCKEMAKLLRSNTDFEVIDHVALKLQANQEKRLNRR